MPSLIDSHSHPHFQAFKDDWREVIDSALAKDTWALLVGTQQETSKRGVEIAEMYDEGVYASIAIHPVHRHPSHYDENEISFQTRGEVFGYETYKKLAQSKKVVAIGESGLDYFHVPEGFDQNQVKQDQAKMFREHIELALELNLPMSIHCREAYDDLYNILKDYPKLRGVAHCYLGDVKQAEKFFKLGLYIGVTGIVTFKNAKQLHEVVKTVPLERILVETDCPYLTPEPHRGKRNLPEYVEFVARRIADLRKMDYNAVAEATTKSARSLFNI
ncbi:MAG: hydrolase TatD [Candidatus Buchananbacteria bacterium CG10_big_fil_rev_8_21_14_0_10_42_9]|uniref:Hydrolase TatD n=1 Tax=Candidatus Buchananbacteria bacterium CG10_big_fil_rev_8_21_14_0_10_42_9 TaxID=1974526 RepID=A0A2H0W073_9BACT|nr:MAG: hydrolase TatD [Candidatus Buchananbacteria bacterium CG10_big_fil_rev_8_21_14_0_10_42_9]